MRGVLLALVLAVTSCGSDEPDDWFKGKKKKEEPPVKREEPIPALKEILDSFLDDCGTKYGADVSDINKMEYIRYGDPATEDSPTNVGVCWTWHYDDGTLHRSNITVKKMQTAISMRALLYHELGHCVLSLDHTDQESRTMMSPSMHSDVYYEENWDQLVEDMCHKYVK